MPMKVLGSMLAVLRMPLLTRVKRCWPSTSHSQSADSSMKSSRRRWLDSAISDTVWLKATANS